MSSTEAAVMPRGKEALRAAVQNDLRDLLTASSQQGATNNPTRDALIHVYTHNALQARLIFGFTPNAKVELNRLNEIISAREKSDQAYGTAISQARAIFSNLRSSLFVTPDYNDQTKTLDEINANSDFDTTHKVLAAVREVAEGENQAIDFDAESEALKAKLLHRATKRRGKIN